jgi:hypothetical protein
MGNPSEKRKHTHNRSINQKRQRQNIGGSFGWWNGFLGRPQFFLG